MDYRKNFILDVLTGNVDVEELSWVQIEELYNYEASSKPGDRARKHYNWFINVGIKINQWAPGQDIDEDIEPVEERVLGRRRLFFDIETSPNIGLFWNAGYKQNIDYDNIIKERAIICICYKWEGEQEAHALYWDEDQSDKNLLLDFIEIANQADELIGHNGDKFDLAWIRTRCLYHRIPMFPKYTTLDTLKVARSKFRFNSNRLDYIAKFLGLGEKIHTSFSLWKEVLLNNSKEALNEMINYCKGDVILLEQVFNVLKNHVDSKQHYGALYLGDKTSCPECGSRNTRKLLTKTTPTGLLRHLHECDDCGKFSYQK